MKSGMPSRRQPSITANVTNEEYARLEVLAGTQKISTWAHDVLLRTAQPDPTDRAVLAELVALRTILVNLHFAIANGQRMTVEQMQTLIDRADQDKWSKAGER